MNKFFFCFLLLISFPAFAQEENKPLLNIQTVTSPGGITAWLVEDHNVPVISLIFAFKDAGTSLDPADKQGLAQMLSNTMDEGAGDLDSKAFQKALHDQAIGLSFGADRDDFTGGLNTLTRYKDNAFNLLKLALTKPRFDEEAITRMRASNQSTIRSALSDPDWMSARIMNDKAFAGHPYSQNSGGTLSSLDNIKVEDLKKLHGRVLGRNNLVVSVCGDITKEELAIVLDQIFGELPVIAPLPVPADVQLQNMNKVFVYETPIPQTIVEIMHPGIKRADPQFQIAQVMNFILGSSGFGSRLMDEIREKRGLTYGIYSSFVNMTHFDGLEVSTSTQNKNAGEVLTLTKQEWNKMKDAPVTPKELMDAKNYLIGSLPLSLTSTEQIANLLVSLQRDDLPMDYLEKRQRAIEAASAEDVQKLAQKLLNADQMTTVLVGKPEGVPAFETITELPNVK